MRSLFYGTCVLSLLVCGGCGKDKKADEKNNKDKKRVVVSKDRLDLAYLPDGYFLTASIRPNRILDAVASEPEQRALVLKELKKAISQSGIPIDVPDLESLEQVVVAVDANVVEQAMSMGMGAEESKTEEFFEEGKEEFFEESRPEDFEKRSDFDDGPKFKESDGPGDSTFDESGSDSGAALHEGRSGMEGGTYFVSAKAAESDDLKSLVEKAKAERESSPFAPDEMPGMLLIVRYSKKIDPQAFAEQLMPRGFASDEKLGPGDEPSAPKLEKHSVDGKPFYTIMPMAGFLVLDDRTFLFAPVEGLPAIVNADPGSDDPLKAELRSHAGDGDFFVSLVMPAELRQQAAAMAGELGEEVPPNMQGVTKLPESLQAASLSISFSGETLAQLSIKAKDKSAIDGLKSSAEEGLKMVRQFLPDGAGASSEGPGAAVALARELLGGIQLKASNNQFTVKVAKPEKLAETMATLMAEAKVQAEAAAEMNDLKQIGLAFHNYHDAHSMMPPAKNPEWFDAKTGKPHLSWRVHILPFIECYNLYERFRLNEPWDSEHNIKLLDEMPEIYMTAGDSTKTSMMMVVGEGTGYEGKHGLRFQDFVDGTSTTILVVKAGADKAVPWTKPDDLPFNSDDPIAAFGKPDGKRFLAVRVDGSVMDIPVDISPDELRAMITRRGMD